MDKYQIKQWTLLLLDRVFETVNKIKEENRENKDEFYKTFVSEDKVHSWRNKYRSLMNGNESGLSDKTYEIVSDVLRNKMQLTERYAEYENPIEPEGIEISEIIKYIECINRSVVEERMKKRKWANNDDEHYGKNFEERLKKAIVNELEEVKDNGQKKKNIISPVQGIVYYFQHRKSYDKVKAAEYGRDILKFISEYKKNKYMLQYISGDDLEKCANGLSEMVHDMMAVKRYRNIVQK